MNNLEKLKKIKTELIQITNDINIDNDDDFYILDKKENNIIAIDDLESLTSTVDTIENIIETNEVD